MMAIPHCHPIHAPHLVLVQRPSLLFLNEVNGLADTKTNKQQIMHQ